MAWLDADRLLLNDDAQLWRLSYPSGEVSRITNDLIAYRHLSLTADRQTLVTTRSERRAKVWVGTANGATGTDASNPRSRSASTSPGLPAVYYSSAVTQSGASSPARGPLAN